MSAKVKAEDIFNLPEDDNHSDASGYDSDEQQSSQLKSKKKNTSASSKNSSKKKSAVIFGLDQIESDDENDYSSQDEDDEQDELKDQATATSDSRFQLDDEKEDDSKNARVRGAKKQRKVKPLTPEALEKFQAAREKTGIVYLSRIPPFMKPVKLRHLLGKFGELGRVYLAPEGT